MAPFQGPSRKQVLALLADKPLLPITLGRGAPQATINCADGIWRLRPLLLDKEKCDAFGREQLAQGHSFMPEHTWQFLYGGAPLIESARLDEFITRLRKLPWPY